MLATSTDNIGIQTYYNQICDPLYLWLFINILTKIVKEYKSKRVLNEFQKTKVQDLCYLNCIKYSFRSQNIKDSVVGDPVFPPKEKQT